jgi:hypothetical protein
MAILFLVNAELLNNRLGSQCELVAEGIWAGAKPENPGQIYFSANEQ